MPQQGTVFVKVSGDEFQSKAFFKWLEQFKGSKAVVICVGGGTQINEAFAREGLPDDTPHGPMGRETKNYREYHLARKVLERNQQMLKQYLIQHKLHSFRVIIPMLTLGNELVHVNADQMVRNAYIGFERTFVITTPDRVENKKSEFRDILEFSQPGYKPRLEIVGLEVKALASAV